MIVLGIESSCDETAVAVVQDGKYLLANTVFSSMDLHTVYGGVVPEIAARSHIESVIPVIEQALVQAFGKNKDLGAEGAAKKPSPHQPSTSCQSDPWDHIDAIAVTYGAGLGGSLLVGVMTANTLAIAKNKPLYAINHVEAHVYANFLLGVGPEGANNDGILDGKKYSFPAKQSEFPMLALIVSGGHTQLVLFKGHFDYEILGQKRDDAVGEAFDKVAKIVGLPYPGGPSIAKAAVDGDPFKYDFPKARLSPLKQPRAPESISQVDVKSAQRSSDIKHQVSSIHSSTEHNYDFSFSGVKTAVLRLAQKEIGEDFTFPSFKVSGKLSVAQKNDIAASFQRIAIETLVDKTVLAYEEFAPKSVVIAGGVAASGELRKQLSERLRQSMLNQEQPQDAAPQVSSIKYQVLDIEDILIYPDMKLCTDNGAMIATLGCYKAMLSQPTADPYSLSIEPNLSM